MSDWNFVNPPVWEAGIAALTENATALDDYDVASVHDLFKKEFPRAERQPPIGMMAPFITEGDQSLVPTINFHQIEATATARWWFTSDDGANLIQIQDQFLGRNWRKLGPGCAPEQGYPQFQGLLSGFQDMVRVLSGNCVERERLFPSPSICDIIYVNMLPLNRPDGGRIKVRDVLPMMQFDDEIMKTGLQFQWFERFGPDTRESVLHIIGHVIAVPGLIADNPDALSPMIRLSLNARAPCRTWDEHSEIANDSHEYMRQRLLALTTPTAQSTWNVR